MSMTFRALWVTETADNTFERTIIERDTDALPAGDVLINVKYSSLNYKDALSATGNRGVTRKYPHTPGIDAAGIVADSQHPDFKAGDAVIVTSFDLGMNMPGGFAEYIRVPAEWVIPLPEQLTLEESMVYGTAGFTAALSIFKLQVAGLRPENGEVLVTGASGGVGCVAVAMLAKLGYDVVAMSGKPEAQEFLKNLGAKEIIGRDGLVDDPKRPLLKSRWAGVLDAVGGSVLATALKMTQYGAPVSCCGLVASPDLPASVMPFILRGVTLLGIDSQNCPMPIRCPLWTHMATDWKVDNLMVMSRKSDLAGVNNYIDRILKAQVQGRVVIEL